MKIAYFLDFPHNVGGSNKVLLTQAYIMRKRGHRVVVVIPDDENGHALEYDKICKNYKLTAITAKFSISTCMECIDIVSVFDHYDEIFRLLKKENVDLIHSTQLNITVEMVSRELQIPHLMNIYQTDIEMFNIKWLNLYPHYHSADSKLFSKRWEEGLDIVSRCIRVAYEVKEKKISNRIENAPLKFLSIGALTKRKNQLEIIKFVLICKQNGIKVRLILLGNNNTSYGEECKQFVKKNNLENEIIFQGFVSDVEHYLLQADLMILASTVESFPSVIVESMANRIPVLSSPVAGIPELLQDEYNAFLTTGTCAQDIYISFKRFMIYKNNGKIQNIINHAYETYTQNHTYKIVGENLEKYYNWILNDFSNSYQQIKLEDAKTIFKNFVSKDSLKNTKIYSEDNLWFFAHFQEKIKLKSPKKVAIWGAGNYGKLALKWIKILNYEDRFIGFIDTYKEGKYFGYSIVKAEKQIIISCDVIILAIGDINDCLEIMNNLDNYGKIRNEDYFLILNGSNRI